MFFDQKIAKAEQSLGHVFEDKTNGAKGIQMCSPIVYFSHNGCSQPIRMNQSLAILGRNQLTQVLCRKWYMGSEDSC